MTAEKKLGFVTLVGAGPGDPDLITVAGRRALAAADCVVFDKLVDPRLVDLATLATERHYVGKEGAGHYTPQEQINALLIDAAGRGLNIVRLKGGDPLLFARGAEEAVALAAAGVPFAIVPGVTAALAAAATAGIPLTHRGAASAVAFITGHQDPATADALDWSAVARFPGTLVLYMALARTPTLARTLLDHGKPADTPTALVEWAGSNRQRVVETNLAALANDPSITEPLRSPTLAIIGEVCGFRSALAWFEHRPLFGQGVLTLRPLGQADDVVDRLRGLGAIVYHQPAFSIAAPADWASVDAVLRRLDQFDWLVFTSRNGVEALVHRLWATGYDLRLLSGLKLAAIGPATAAALAEFHLRADVVPADFRAESLAESLAPRVAGRRVLWLRADRGREILPELLANAGAAVETAVVYRQVDVVAPAESILAALREGKIDWVLLSSSNMAAAFFGWLNAAAAEIVKRQVRLASISPVTTETIRQRGFSVAAEASTYTMDGMIDAILACGTRTESRSPAK